MSETWGRLPESSLIEELRADAARARRRRVDAVVERFDAGVRESRRGRVEAAERRLLGRYLPRARAAVKAAGLSVSDVHLRGQLLRELAHPRERRASVVRRSGRLSATLGDRSLRPAPAVPRVPRTAGKGADGGSPRRAPARGSGARGGGYAEWFREHPNGGDRW